MDTVILVCLMAGFVEIILTIDHYHGVRWWDVITYENGRTRVHGSYERKCNAKRLARTIPNSYVEPVK